MKRRADRNRELEAVKNTLFESGVSVVKAAKAHEEMFMTSMQMLTDAMSLDEPESQLQSADSTLLLQGAAPSNSFYFEYLQQRQAAEQAMDFDAYLEAEHKLKELEELEIGRLERNARKLEAQLRIEQAQRQLQHMQHSESEVSVSSRSSKLWTEETLKATYKTLGGVAQALDISAKSWKEAVKKANLL
ncbi:hypothetical protein ACQ4M4_23475 [Leptolyngbya sp. AN02str]|uniref:hypothetical protein n=1 Tax=Leptolyngbya sp. AN02str TaxID=3423363 RepID=UPI003D31745F